MQGQVEVTGGGVGAVAVAAPAPAPVARRRRRETVPYWLLAPTILFMAAFFVWPMLQALASWTANTSAWSRSAG